MKGTRYILVIALLMLSIAGAIGTPHNAAIAEGDITVVRDLPDSAMFAPGDTFDVIITFTAPVDAFNSVVLHDEVPAGWQVAVDKDACHPTPLTEKVIGNREIEYTWLGPYDAGQAFFAVYEVTLPEVPIEGTHILLDGWLMYYIVTDEHQVEITGESQVLIKNGATEPPVTTGEPVINNTPDDTECESCPDAAIDTNGLSGLEDGEIAEVQMESPAPASTQSGGQGISPELDPSESTLLYPPASRSESVNWPVLGGIAGGVVIIVLLVLIRHKRRTY